MSPPLYSRRRRLEDDVARSNASFSVWRLSDERDLNESHDEYEDEFREEKRHARKKHNTFTPSYPAEKTWSRTRRENIRESIIVRERWRESATKATQGVYLRRDNNTFIQTHTHTFYMILWQIFLYEETKRNSLNAFPTSSCHAGSWRTILKARRIADVQINYLCFNFIFIIIFITS